MTVTRRNYRGKMQIIRDILYAIARTSTTTHILYQSNLNGALIKKYMPYLERQGLITCNPIKNNRYESYLTDKGREAIHDFRSLDLLLDLEAHIKDLNVPWRR